MKKIRLLTPGPTPVPERLSLRMAQPIVHHRSPEFEQVFARCREGLSWLFQTKQDVVQLAASGTGAMEASLVNFLRRGDEAIVVVVRCGPMTVTVPSARFVTYTFPAAIATAHG